MRLNELHAIISAVAPIDGLNSSGDVWFKGAATEAQKAAAIALVEQHIADIDSVAGHQLPVDVSPWQIRKALNRLGLRDAVESAVDSADLTTQDAWAYATEFVRSDPLVTALGHALGKTDEELDGLFALAASL